MKRARKNNSIYDLLDRLGIEIIAERQNKHRVATLRLPDGRQVNMVLSVSPSDRRSYLNARAWLHKVLNQRSVTR